MWYSFECGKSCCESERGCVQTQTSLVFSHGWKSWFSWPIMKSFSAVEIMKCFQLWGFHTHQDRMFFTKLGLGFSSSFWRTDAMILKHQIYFHFTRLSLIYSLKLGIFSPAKEKLTSQTREHTGAIYSDGCTLGNLTQSIIMCGFGHYNMISVYADLAQ